MNTIDLSKYKFKLPIEIRFADFDLLAHVNNAAYLTYLEEARIKYFGEVITRSEMDWRQEGMILARMEIDFRKPITGYKNYFVYIRCSRLGNKSFDFNYVMTKEENNSIESVAEAKSVMVCYDYEKNQTVEMREDWKEKVRAFEGVEL
ncbi:MAG TPA: thioesterase family protein [Chitinophagales bacterium]|nr:thioesterase family protein [Chitinophagales bacterium]